MSQILRYTGKTNEQFTRLMVNLGVSAANTDSTQLTLMDQCVVRVRHCLKV